VVWLALDSPAQRPAPSRRTGAQGTSRGYLVSTGRFALRGIGQAQDLYTLDPDVASDEAASGGYERYLAT